MLHRRPKKIPLLLPRPSLFLNLQLCYSFFPLYSHPKNGQTLFMKRKWIFLFSLGLLMLSNISKASYAYYEDPEEPNENYQSHYIDEDSENTSEETSENELATRLNEEQQKLSELSQNIDLKLPEELELEHTLSESANETQEGAEIDTTEVKQSAPSRKPAIKKEDQVDLTEEETQSLFPEESDEVSLSHSAILKTSAETSAEPSYRTRKIRSR